MTIEPHALHQLSDYIAKRLNQTERAAVKKHLSHCADCRAAYQRLKNQSPSTEPTDLNPGWNPWSWGTPTKVWVGVCVIFVIVLVSREAPREGVNFPTDVVTFKKSAAVAPVTAPVAPTIVSTSPPVVPTVAAVTSETDNIVYVQTMHPPEVALKPGSSKRVLAALVENGPTNVAGANPPYENTPALPASAIPALTTAPVKQAAAHKNTVVTPDKKIDVITSSVTAVTSSSSSSSTVVSPH